MRCWGLQKLANPSYLSRFPFPGLPVLQGFAFAMVSEWCQASSIRACAALKAQEPCQGYASAMLLALATYRVCSIMARTSS